MTLNSQVAVDRSLSLIDMRHSHSVRLPASGSVRRTRGDILITKTIYLFEMICLSIPHVPIDLDLIQI